MANRFSFGAELPEWAKDAVHGDIEATVSFGDRLRILLLGRFSLQTVAYTENLVGRTSGESRFIAPRLRLWRRKHHGYVMEPEPEPVESVTPGAEG